MAIACPIFKYNPPFSLNRVNKRVAALLCTSFRDDVSFRTFVEEVEGDEKMEKEGHSGSGRKLRL